MMGDRNFAAESDDRFEALLTAEVREMVRVEPREGLEIRVAAAVFGAETGVAKGRG